MKSRIFLLLFLFLTLGCITQKELGIGNTTITTLTINEENILKIATQNTDVKEFTLRNPGFQYKITALESADTKTLSEKYPALYGNLSNKTVYQVDYKYSNEGILVIIDLENEKILKQFITTGVSLSET